MTVKRRRRMLGLLLVAMFSLSLSSCVPWQWEYLINATDRVTQDEVKKRFGDPLLAKNFGEDTSIWTYRYEVSSSLWMRRGDMVGGQRCIEYVLTFDIEEVLRHWVRQPC